MADGDEDDSEEQWKIWKNELVDDGFTKVELEGHKHWIKARLQELIESGGLQEDTLPEENIHSRSPRKMDSDATRASSSKTPEHTYVEKRQPKLQATVEDAKDDEEQGPENDATRLGDTNTKGDANIIIPKNDVVMDIEVDEGSSEETDQGSDETDDTFLPSDSISNIGLNTMTTDNLASASSSTRIQQSSPSRPGVQSQSSNETSVIVDSLWQQSLGSQEHLTPGTENGQRASGVRPQPRTTDRVSKRKYNTRAEGEKTRYQQQIHKVAIDPHPDSRPTEQAQAAQRQESKSNRRGKKPSGPHVIINEDESRHEPRKNQGKTYYEEPPHNYSNDESESESDSNSNSTTSTQEATRSRKEKSNIQSQPRSQRFSGPTKPAHIPDRSREPRTDSPSYQSGFSSENRRAYDTTPHLDPRLYPHSDDSPKLPLHPWSPYRPYMPPQDRTEARPSVWLEEPLPSSQYYSGAGGFSSGHGGSSYSNEYTRGQPERLPPEGVRHESRGGVPGDGGFTFSNPESIFAEFLRGQSGMGGGEGFEELFSGVQERKDRRRRSIPLEPSIVERPLPLSLEEIFRGTHKKMKIKRKVMNEVTGKRETHDKVLEMDLRPGIKKGSKIKYKGVGDQEEGGQQDLHFIIEEKVHPLFSRHGDDIHHTITLSLSESLCGWERTVSTIDNKQIKIEKAGPTQPGSSDTYPDLGMPLPKKPDTRGKFIVTYDVKYSTMLTRQQKNMIKDALS